MATYQRLSIDVGRKEKLTCLGVPSTLTSPLNPAIFFPAFWNIDVIACFVWCFVFAAASAILPSSAASSTSSSSSAVTVAGEVSLMASLGVPARGGGLRISKTPPVWQGLTAVEAKECGEPRRHGAGAASIAGPWEHRSKLSYFVSQKLLRFKDRLTFAYPAFPANPVQAPQTSSQL